MKTRTGMRRTRRGVGGFTLVELLVVIAVIALLIGVLLPTIGEARRTAWGIVSANIQRQFSQGIAASSVQSDDFIPGVNHPRSLSLRNLYISNRTRFWEVMESDPGAPVQACDYITLSVGDGELPANYGARWWQILERYRDPAMNTRSVPFGGGVDGVAIDKAEQYAIEEQGGSAYAGVSYMMPFAFQLYGFDPDGSNGRALSVSGNRVVAVGNELYRRSFFQVQGNTGYVPRYSLIQNPSNKIASVTAFRYLDVTGPDFDVSWPIFDDGSSLNTGLYGSFTTSGPVFTGSTAFGWPSEHPNNGGGRVNASGGQQIPLTYRHDGRLVAAFFDGSARRISEDDSFDPTYWYPSGSVFDGRGDTAPKSRSFYEQGDKIN